MEGKGEKSANPPNHRPFVMSPAQVLYSFLAFGLGTTFTVFLALKLDEQVKWKWLVVFAPMIVREGLNIFTFRMRGRYSLWMAPMTRRVPKDMMTIGLARRTR